MSRPRHERDSNSRLPYDHDHDTFWNKTVYIKDCKYVSINNAVHVRVNSVVNNLVYRLHRFWLSMHIYNASAIIMQSLSYAVTDYTNYVVSTRFDDTNNLLNIGGAHFQCWCYHYAEFEENWQKMLQWPIT